MLKPGSVAVVFGGFRLDNCVGTAAATAVVAPEVLQEETEGRGCARGVRGEP